jgi:hypothetical protein
VAKFRVTSPDGRIYEVNAPEGATQADAIAYVQQQAKAPTRAAVQTEARGGFLSDLTNPDKDTYYGTLMPVAREPSGAKRLGAPLVLQDLAKLIPIPGQIARGQIAPSPENLAPLGRDMALQFAGGGTSLSATTRLGPPAGSLAMNALPPIAKAVTKGVTAVAQPLIDRLDQEAAIARILAKRVMQQNPGLDLPKAIEATRARLAEFGPQGVLADTGESVRGLADNMVNNPGESATRAKAVLEPRAASEGSRMVRSVEKNVSPENFYDVKGANDATKKLAGPLYESAYSAHDNLTSDGLQLLLQQEPLVKQGLNKGIELQRIEASTARQKFEPDKYGVVVDFAADGAPVIKEINKTPLRLWHAAREGLDAMLEAYRDQTTGKLNLDKRGLRIQDLRKSLSDEIKQLAGGAEGDFARADAIFADASKLNTALERGRAFVRGDEEITEKIFKAMPAKEQEAYRAGVAREMTGMIRKAGTTPKQLRDALKDTGIRDKLRAILPTEAQFNKFTADLEREATFKETNAIRRNSKTFARQAEDADANEGVAGQVVGAGVDAMRGNTGGLVARAVGLAQSMLKRTQMPQGTRDKIGRLLLSQNPADQEEAFRLLESVKNTDWVYAP